MSWSSFPWHLFYQVAWSWCPAHLSFHGSPSKNPTTISHVILWGAVLSPILSHWSPPTKFPDWGPLYCFDIALLWHPIQFNHCLAKNIPQAMKLSCLIQYWQHRQLQFETRCQWQWYDISMNHMFVYFFNWRSKSYDSWLIIWHVT